MPKRIWKTGKQREKSLRKSARRMAKNLNSLLQSKKPVTIGALVAQNNFFANRPPQDLAVLQAEFAKARKKSIGPKRKANKLAQFADEIKKGSDRISQTIPELDRFERFLNRGGIRPTPNAIRKAEQDLHQSKNRLCRIYQHCNSAITCQSGQFDVIMARRIRRIIIGMLPQVSHGLETIERLKKKLEIK
ncbi:MAG: hypothetical protein V1777_01660 [Candidatus Micrarchaeota archaeon]